MQGATILSLSELGALDIVAVGFVDDDAVSHLHDAALDALELVAAAGNLYEEEEVDHGVYGGLALSDADSFDKYVVEAGSLAQYDGLAGAAGDTTEATCRRAGANEGIGVNGEFLHAGFIAEDGAAGDFAGGVDGEDCEARLGVTEDVEPEDVDRGALAGAGDAGDAYATGATRVGEALLDYFLGASVVLGRCRLHEGDGASQCGDIPLENALDEHRRLGQGLAPTAALQIGIDYGWLCHTLVDGQPGVVGRIFGMFHNYIFDNL